MNLSLLECPLISLVRHYRGADAAILTFDFTRESTFDSIATWINEVKDNVPSECVFALVGNKVCSLLLLDFSELQTRPI